MGKAPFVGEGNLESVICKNDQKIGEKLYFKRAPLRFFVGG